MTFFFSGAAPSAGWTTNGLTWASGKGFAPTFSGAFFRPRLRSRKNSDYVSLVLDHAFSTTIRPISRKF
jgi:hypothetical protein